MSTSGADQLPAPYFHIAFTLPHRLNPWVQSHPEVGYRALFHAAWGTLDAFGHDAKRLGGQLGHDGRAAHLGPETDPARAPALSGPGRGLGRRWQWVPVKGSYPFPVRALSRHFRGRMVSALRHAATAGELAGIDSVEVWALLDDLMAEDWVGYAKPRLEHTESVITYLARYTYRIALSNARILGLDGDNVHLRYRDYRDGEHKTLLLEAPERVRRFLLHVLPKGLMRVRHYGVLANRCRVQRLAQIREILTAPPRHRPSRTRSPAKPASTSRAGLVRCAGKGSCARCARSRRARRHWAVRLIADALSPSG